MCSGTIGVCAIVALAWLQQRAFARAGTRYPANLSEAITIGLWCAAGLALAWRVVGQRLMLAVFAIYAAVGAVAALLYAPAEGPALTAWRDRARPTTDDPRVDDEMDQSFPASDPPSWTPATTGTHQ